MDGAEYYHKSAVVTARMISISNGLGPTIFGLTLLLPGSGHAATKETREKVGACDVEVGNEGAVGFVHVIIAFPGHASRRRDDELEEHRRRKGGGRMVLEAFGMEKEVFEHGAKYSDLIKHAGVSRQETSRFTAKTEDRSRWSEVNHQATCQPESVRGRRNTM